MKNYLLALVAFMCASLTASADNWMKNLPDDAYVAEVSIPGSHDSGTGNGLGKVFSLVDGTPYAQTQDIDLAAQWGLGVRAFDLRPCTTSDGYLNVNHGIVPTNIRFDDAMYLLRDSIAANPTEFAIIHLLHESDGDSGKYDYETLLHELFDSDELKDYLVDFRRDLTVGDMRGKILVLYRDSYSTRPAGGLMTGWVGYINWSAQTGGKITGAGSGTYASSPLYMQDFSDTHEDGAVDEKVAGVKTMLDYTTTHQPSSASDIVWVYNFASGYSKMTSIILGLVDVSSSDGYRDNATYTNAAIVDYLKENSGPTGIILADYVGVDTSVGEDKSTYATMGAALVEAIIDNNFKYLDYVPDADKDGLAYVIEEVEAKDFSANVGDGAFQIPESYVSAIDDALTEAKAVLDKDGATEDDYAAAFTALEEAVEAYGNAPLNAPNEGDIFNLIMVDEGLRYAGYPISFYEGTNTKSGNYGLSFSKALNVNYGQAFTLTPAEGADFSNGYIISFTDVEGARRYLCNGNVYGNSAANIRTTDSEDEAYAFRLIADTGVDGVWYIYNAAADAYIGSSAASSTSITSTDAYYSISLQTAERVSVTPAAVDGWATLCLPFAAAVPEGWTVYSCEGMDSGRNTLTLSEEETLAANTPYIVCTTTEETFTGTGTYYSSYSLEASLLVGTMEETTVAAGTYLMGTAEETGVAFYPASGEVSLPAYRAYIAGSVGDYEYLALPCTETGIARVTVEEGEKAMFDLSGRRVSSAAKGIYIKGGKKVVIR